MYLLCERKSVAMVAVGCGSGGAGGFDGCGACACAHYAANFNYRMFLQYIISTILPAIAKIRRF